MSRHPTGAELAVKRLERAAAKYTTAKKKADELMAVARTELASAVVDGHNDGVRKVDIGRHIDNVWSRAWIEKTINAAKAETS